MEPHDRVRFKKNPRPGRPPQGQVDFVYSETAGSMVVRDSSGDETVLGGGSDPTAALTAMEAMTPEQQADAKTAIGVPFISVIDYGADPTGAADSTAEVQAAVDAAEASTLTRTVFFPPGTYKFNVDIPEGVMVQGAGTALQADSPSSQHQTICVPFNDTLPCFWVKYGTGQSISRMAFEGNGNGTSVCAIRQKTESGSGYAGMGVVLDHLFISGFTRGLDAKNVNMLRCSNLSVTACGHGAYFESVDTYIFDNCSFWANETLGIYGNQSRGGVIRGGDHGTQSVPLFSFTNGGTVEISNTHIEGMTGSRIIEVGNTELNVHDCSWLDMASVANVALVRKTYFQFGVTISNIFISGVPAYTGTDYPLIWESEDASSPAPVVTNTNGAIRWCTDNTYSADREVDTTLRWGTRANPPLVRFDEFLGGTGVTGSIGDTGWSFYNYAGTGNVTRQVSSAPNFGIIRVATSATSGHTILLYLGEGASEVTNLITSQTHVPWEQLWALTLGQTTSNIIHVGFVGGSPTTGVPPDFLGFVFDPGSSANWRAYSRIGGVSSTLLDTGVAGSTSRVKLRIRSLKSGTARFSVNGGTEQVIAATGNLGAMSPAVMVYTGTSAARHVDIDYNRFQQLMTNR